MRLSDLTDFDRTVGLLIRLIGALFVLIFAAEFVCDLLNRLTFLDTLGLLGFFVLVSPMAYLIWKRRQPPGPDRPRGGAERTPLLPPTEDEE